MAALIAATGTAPAAAESPPPDLPETLRLVAEHELTEPRALGVNVAEALTAATRTAVDGSRTLEIDGPLVVSRDGTGQTLETAQLEHDPGEARGVTVAPSSDRTDASDATSLFVLSAEGVIYEYALNDTAGGRAGDPATHDTATVAAARSARVVRTINTFAWSAPSPDPSGLGYQPFTGRLVVVDGEVDEMPARWRGVNGWEASTTGLVQRTFSTTAYNNEPTGAAASPVDGAVFISSDTAGRVWRIDPRTGAAQLFLTTSLPSPEGIAIAGNRLYIVDDVDREVYVFDLTTKALVDQFDVAAHGQTMPEGIDYHPQRGTLFIVSNQANNAILEVTLDGGAVNTFDAGVEGAGLAVAPATSGTGFSLYVADRGVDNNTDPNENDGRIYEISIGSAPSPRPAPSVTRVAGTDRYATAAAVSRQVINPARGGTVYIANGLNFPDALAGAPAAKRDGAPLLLVTAGSVPAATCSEIGRLNPIRIVVLGSEAVVSAATAAAAARCSALAVTTQRLAGADRYATAAAVAASRFPAAKTIMLTNGLNFPDALSGSGAAARYGFPILLAQATRLPPVTCQRIGASDPTRIYVLGSAAVVSDAVASAARACSSAAPSVIRLGGADRFATSALINAWFFNSANADRALVATGFNFPDALGAGPAGDPVYLTRPDDLPDAITQLIAVLDPSAINVVGGSTVVSDGVMRELSAT